MHMVPPRKPYPPRQRWVRDVEAYRKGVCQPSSIHTSSEVGMTRKPASDSFVDWSLPLHAIAAFPNSVRSCMFIEARTTLSPVLKGAC